MANEWTHPIGWTLLHFVWQGAAISGLLFVALRLVRPSKPQIRYVLASLALLLMVASPLVTLGMLKPATATVTYESAGAAYIALPRAAEMPTASLSMDGYLPIAVGLWAAGVLFFSLRLLGAWLSVERTRRKYCQPVEAEWQQRLDILSVRLGLRRKIRLLESAKFDAPATIGVLRAFVIVPLGFFTKLPTDQVEALLMHELAHIRRQDYLINVLQSVAETALFYHPAVWWVSSVIRRERELCCDEIVVHTLGNPVGYARALTFLAESQALFAPLPLSATGGSLMTRIQHILSLDSSPARATRSRWIAPAGLAATASIAGLLMFGGVNSVRAQIAPSPAPIAHPKPKISTKIKVKSKAKKKTPTVRGMAPTTVPPMSKAAIAPPSSVPGFNPVSGTAFAADRIAPSAAVGPNAPAAKAVIRYFPSVAAPVAGPIPQARSAADYPAAAIATDAIPAPAPASANDDDPVSLTVRLNFTNVKLEEAMMKVAKMTGTSIAMAPGTYPTVSANLHNLDAMSAIKTLCFASGATWSLESGVFKITMAQP